jgi:peptidoglycan/LPS O-acetylase OafA/YrhL
MVIVSHAFVLGGFGSSPKWNETTLGSFAVTSFFCLSGFLITKSAERLNLVAYISHRITRIFPAYWLSIFLVGFVFSNIANHIMESSAGWSLNAALDYVSSGLPMILPRVDQVAETLSSNPFPYVWNGSLWTLRFELMLYFATIPILFLRNNKRKLILLSITYSSLLIIKANGVIPTGNSGLFNLLDFSIYFLSGSILYSIRASIKLKKRFLLLSIIVLLIGTWASLDLSALSMPLSYLLIYFGYFRNKSFVIWTTKNDISYGMFLFAFPIQQILALLDFQRFGVMLFIFYSIAFTLPIALISCFFIEKPANRLGSFLGQANSKPQEIRLGNSYEK